MVNLDQWFSKAFTEFVLQGMYRYVKEVPQDSPNQMEPTLDITADLEILDLVGRKDSVDLLKLNLPARLLVVLSNVSYLQGEGLRNLISIFSNENIAISANPMVSALSNVERAVTQLFLQGQIGKIIGPIETEWLSIGTISSSFTDDSYSLSPSIYKSLLSLSDVQNLISDIGAKDPLTLLRDLSNSLISSFLNTLKSNVNISDTSIIIQGRLDVEFVKRRFEESNLLTIESMELFEKIFLILESDKIDFYEIWGKFENNWTRPFSNLFSF